MLRTRPCNAKEQAVARRKASTVLVGYSDHEQYEADYNRLNKRSYKVNLEDRDRMQDKIHVNDTRLFKIIAEALRLHTEMLANEAVCEDKSRIYNIAVSEQETREQFASEEADRKQLEKERRAKVNLATVQGQSVKLGGAKADRRDAMQDKYDEPGSDYMATDCEESDPEPEVQVKKKTKKANVAMPEKKGKESVEEKKEVSAQPLVPPVMAKPSGFISGLYAAMSIKDKPEITHEIKVQKMARLAYHLKKINRDYVLNEEEERALACLNSFPQWLSAPTSMEESGQIIQALMKQSTN